MIYIIVVICNIFVNCFKKLDMVVQKKFGIGGDRTLGLSLDRNSRFRSARLTAARSDQLSYDTYQLALEENDTLTVTVMKTKIYIVSVRVWVCTLGFTYR